MGECFFWYRPTRVVPDQRPLNGRCCCCIRRPTICELDSCAGDADPVLSDDRVPAKMMLERSADVQSRLQTTVVSILYIYLHIVLHFKISTSIDAERGF